MKYQRFRCLLLVTLCGTLVASNAAEAPAFEMRGWVLLDYTMPYLRDMIPRAAEAGMNHVQFGHLIGMNVSDYLEPARNRDVRELTDLSHQHGLKTYVWTHELDDVPERFIRGGKVVVEGEEFWEWMRGRYRTLLDALPNIDGVVITLTETRVCIDDDNLVTSSLTPPERLAKVSQAACDVLHPVGKDVIIRTFTWIEEDYDWMLEAFRLMPEDVIVMTKVNWGDWYQAFPSNPFIGQVAPHRQIIEYDLAGQYQGDTILPWVCDAFLQREMQYALSQNAAGVVGRIEWTGRTYGTANEFNGQSFAALAQNPATDLETVWWDWASSKYGPDAAPHVISALKRTNNIANAVFFTLGLKAFQHSSALDHLTYMDEARIKHAEFVRDVQGRWKPELIPIAEDLLHPTEATIDRVVVEKEEAVALIDECLADLEKARPYLDGEVYYYLESLFRNARLIGRCWRWVSEANLRHVLLHDGDRSQAEPLEEVLNEIFVLADEVEHRWGDRIYLVSPEALRNLATDIRVLANPPVKWIGRTSLESGRKPLLHDLDGDGRSEVIVNARDNAIHAFEDVTGREVWRHETIGLRVYYPRISDPVRHAMADEVGFAMGSADGHLYVFGMNGTLRWKYRTGNGVVCAPAQVTSCQGSRVTLCASTDEQLYGLSPEGELLWQTQTDGVVEANSVVAQLDAAETAMFVSKSGVIQAYDNAGQLQWRRALPGPPSGGLALHERTDGAWLSAGCGSELTRTTLTGQSLPSFELAPGIGDVSVRATTLKDGSTLVGTSEGYLVTWGPDGRVRFSVQVGDDIRTPAVGMSADREFPVLAGVDNAVVAVSASGQETWRFTGTSTGLIGSELVVNRDARELLYTSTGAKLYVVDLREVR